MALLYPWATKEYLLWHMTIGQLVMYHNLGIELRYGKRDGNGAPRTVKDMSYEEVRARREELRRQYGEIGGDDG